jgi:hypothetical protein
MHFGNSIPRFFIRNDGTVSQPIPHILSQNHVLPLRKGNCDQMVIVIWPERLLGCDGLRPWFEAPRVWRGLGGDKSEPARKTDL